MKKFFVAFAVIVVLLIGAALIAPSFIDWTRYRDAIAAELEQAVGRRVVIAGTIDAALLPTPRLLLNDTRLGNLPGAGEPEMARLRSLEARIALLPLLSGRVVVESFVLREPVVTLEVLPDGRRNWVFDLDAPTDTWRMRQAQALPLQSIELKNAAVVNGTILYRDLRTGHEERIEGFNARVVADSLAGPLRAAGEMRADGKPLRFTLATGRFDPRGITLTPVNASFDLVGANSGPSRATLSFNGSAQIGPDLRATGKAKFAGPDLSAVLAALGVAGEMPGFLGQAFNVEGAVSLTDERLEGNGLVVQLGDIRTQGGLSAVFLGPRDGKPQIDLALVMGYLDLDNWLAMPPKLGNGSKPERLVLPTGFRFSLDASAEAINYRKGLLRQIKLSAELADGVVAVRQASAQLPGGTDVAFNGKFTSGEAPARLVGQTDLASDDFRTLLGWIGIDATSLPAGRLNKVSATARLSAAVDTIEANEIDMRFDGTRLTGGIVAALRDRPAFGINLTADRFNLDSYMPAEKGNEQSGLPLAWLGAFDANLLVQSREFMWRQIPMRNWVFDATLADGTATLRKLSAQAGDGGFTLSGTINDIAGKRSFGLDVDVAAKDPVALYRLAGIEAPNFAQRSPLRILGRFEGNANGYRVPKMEMSLGPTQIAGQGELALGGARPKLTAKLDAGELVLDHFVSDDSGSGVSGSAWSAAPLALGILGLADADLKLSAKSLVHESLRIDAPAAALTVEGGRLEMSSFTGRMLGGEVSAKGHIASSEKGASIAANVTLTEAEVKQAMFNSRVFDVTKGKLDVVADLTAEGASEAALIGSLSGKGRIAVTEGSLRGVDLSAVNKRLGAIERPAELSGLFKAGASGASDLSTLTGNFTAENGVVVSDDLALAVEGANGQGSVRIDLPNWQIDATADFKLADHDQAPPLRLTLQGSLNEPEKSLTDEGLQAYVLERSAARAVRRAAPPAAAATPAPVPPRRPAAPQAPQKPVAPAQPDSRQDTQSPPPSGEPNGDAFINDVLRGLGP